ncbi:MAG TPA: CatB-related O-acetyltransferase [Azospirillum sp.]|nr:CatB-related O-acetyltransferase [Azospirillum sp.]
MSVIAINFGPSAAAKLQSLGLKIASARGELSLMAGSYFEAPGSTQPSLNAGTLIQIGAFASLAGGGSMGSVRIGRYVSIAAGVMIGMHNHPVDWLSTSRITYFPQMHEWHKFCGDGGPAVTTALRRRYTGACPITEIGNDVWIGQGVFIKAGVKIGDGAVIGARSVVVKDVEPYTIVAGSPAKPLRRRFPDPVIERLLAMRWWRYSLYDMAGVPFDDVPAALDVIEARAASGDLKEYQAPTYTPADLATLFAPAPAP